MGYYLTTEPENAVPGKSCAQPKTHTPGSPVKERGFRFYMPEAGRWTSRDPIREEGGVNVYTLLHNDPIDILDLLGLKECIIHYWVGHSSEVKKKLPKSKDDQCSRHAIFACNVAKYAKDLPVGRVIPPITEIGMGGIIPGSTDWRIWAATLPFYKDEMTWVDFQVAFVAAQIKAMRNEAAKLALDPDFVCKCNCDDIKIVVHRLDGFRLVPDEAKKLIEAIEDYPWIYHVSQGVKDEAKKKCCPAKEDK